MLIIIVKKKIITTKFIKLQVQFFVIYDATHIHIIIIIFSKEVKMKKNYKFCTYQPKYRSKSDEKKRCKIGDPMRLN